MATIGSKRPLFACDTTNETESVTMSQSNDKKFKRERIFNDPIHGSIPMNGLCLDIIDTYQYQRLHALKQLGACDHVFRGATHTRFSHSIGVAHLAEKITKLLREFDVESTLGITDTDILCVKVSGLCHDLGHGPFSHVYDGVFIKKMYPDGLDGRGAKWRHEEGSIQMFRHLIAENQIDMMSKYNLTKSDIKFIEEIIGGVPESKRKGRPPEKFFLYDIVNNIRSGLDVDKLDYLQRDMQHAGVEMQKPFERFIELGRVLPAEPISSSSVNTSMSYPPSLSSSPSSFPLMICYPEKLCREAINIFKARFDMHQLVYTHKSVKAIEFMICDALAKADPYILISGNKTPRFPTGQYRISQCIFDMKAYSKLRDSILDVIQLNDNPALQLAKDILNRIDNRELYVCLGRTPITAEQYAFSEQEILNQLVVFSKEIFDDSKYHPLKRVCYEPHHDEEDSQYFDGLPGTSSASGLFGSNGASQGFSAGNNGNSNIGFRLNLANNRHDSNNNLASFATWSQSSGVDDASKASPKKRSNHSNISGSSLHFASSDLAFTAEDSEWTEDDVLDGDDIIVEKVHIHYGMKNENPVSFMRFFSKHKEEDEPLIGRKVPESKYETMLPRVFEDKGVRVFCRSQAYGKIRMAKQAFRYWCSKQTEPTPFPSSQFDYSQ